MSMITEFPPVLDQNDQLFEIGFSQSSGELNITAEELEAARSLGDVAVRGGEGVVSGEFTVAEMNAISQSTLDQHFQHVMQTHLDALDKKRNHEDDDDDRDF